MAPVEHDLADEIRAAFEGVSREGGVSLHEAEMIDCRGTDEERAAARKLDIDRAWRDVPDEWLEQFPSVPHFLDPLGFRYYLPAYMIWALRNPSSESATADSVVHNLLREDRLPELRPLLSDGQKRVICKWLRQIASGYYDPEGSTDRAIDILWGDHCGK